MLQITVCCDLTHIGHLGKDDFGRFGRYGEGCNNYDTCFFSFFRGGVRPKMHIFGLHRHANKKIIRKPSSE